MTEMVTDLIISENRWKPVIFRNATWKLKNTKEKKFNNDKNALLKRYLMAEFIIFSTDITNIKMIKNNKLS